MDRCIMLVFSMLVISLSVVQSNPVFSRAPEDSVKKQPARRTNDDIDYMRFAPTIGKRGSRLGGYQSYDTAVDSVDLDYKVRYEILVTALQKLVQAAAEVDVSYPSPFEQRFGGGYGINRNAQFM